MFYIILTVLKVIVIIVGIGLMLMNFLQGINGDKKKTKKVRKGVILSDDDSDGVELVDFLGPPTNRDASDLFDSVAVKSLTPNETSEICI